LGYSTPNLDLLNILRHFAEYGSCSFRGWPGFFSLALSNYIENIGPVPWTTVVYSLRDMIIEEVDTP